MESKLVLRGVVRVHVPVAVRDLDETHEVEDE